MRIAVLTLLACIWAGGAHAQQNMQSLCDKLSVYMPIDGVEFNPGAAEVPADINMVQDPIYGSISIPVEIDLAEYFDRPELEMMPGMDLKPDISNIEINRNGAVFYNGQEISVDIQRYCGGDVDSAVVKAQPNPPPVKYVPKAKPKPKVKPKPRPKPTPKPKVASPKPALKKSNVKVFNGPKAIITQEAVSKPEAKGEPERIVPQAAKPEKAKVKDQNAIDVEVLNAQDNTDETIDADREDDSIIEGQYP